MELLWFNRTSCDLLSKTQFLPFYESSDTNVPCFQPLLEYTDENRAPDSLNEPNPFGHVNRAEQIKKQVR